MKCNCVWLLLLLLSLLGGAWANCPTGFSKEQNKCVQERPIHGTCTPGSTYQLSINKCVHA
ncbi:CG6503 [Drosophila busckii]|uniref:CG6503 n=1 Tax=Drosophila busckii TaxID=30019 RepID=A0A0M4EKM8_DROBS|nr:uncharacterized protein LOC108602336 [Drosophila busckii]ALC45690.1 CG6503 [Drosophila busckii]